MRNRYQPGTDARVDDALAGKWYGGEGNQPWSAVGLAMQRGEWLDPATLLEHGCPQTRALQQLTGDAAARHRNEHGYELVQERQALERSESLRGWAETDPQPPAPTRADLDERERWIAARARELRAAHEAKLTERFTCEAIAEWDAAHGAAPAVKKTTPKKGNAHV